MSDFAGNSVKLAIESIRNAYFRQHYIDVTRQIADGISLDAQHAELMSPCQRVNIWEGAAKKASTLRNDWMHRTRQQLSPSALAFSKMLKSKAPSFADLLAKYSSRPQIDRDLHDSEKNPFDLYDIKYVCSRHSDRVKVFQAIVNSSGRTNTRINVISKVIGLIGMVFLVVTLTLVVLGLLRTDQPSLYMLKCLTSFQTGFLGAYMGSKLGSKIAIRFGQSNCSVFVCAVTLGIVYGCAGALLGSFVISLLEL